MPPMGPSRRIELRLAVYRTATLQSVDGDGDQPWDRTTFSRTSAERYDHTSSLVLADAGSRTRSSCVRSRHAAVNTSSTLVQARGFAPRSSDNRSEVLLLDEAWVLVPATGVEPAWFRLKGGHAAAASRWRCTTTNAHVGWQTWARTTICGFKVRHPAVGRSANGGVGGTRTPTYLRPRQVGYRLPNDPMNWYDRPGSNRD